MAIEIPVGVDHKQFFKQCFNKNIRVRSKYRGVVLSYYNNDKSKPCWMARYQGGGKYIYLGRFEFSEQGEKQARHAYSKYLFENNITERTKNKRSYNSKCQPEKTS